MRSRHLLAVFAASSPLFLSGCGIPPAITIASYVVDAISYGASGKSLEDHALSAIADQDCALHRVIMDEAICGDYGMPVGLPEIALNVPPGAEVAPGVPTAQTAAVQTGSRDRD